MLQIFHRNDILQHKTTIYSILALKSAATHKSVVTLLLHSCKPNSKKLLPTTTHTPNPFFAIPILTYIQRKIESENWRKRVENIVKRKMDENLLDDIIRRLLGVRERPGKQVQLSEAEIKQLCMVSKDIFLQQPNLLELEAPVKICGIISLFLFQFRSWSHLITLIASHLVFYLLFCYSVISFNGFWVDFLGHNYWV